MQIVSTITELRSTLSLWRKQGSRIGFVPTMGNLHAGHIELVNNARRQTDKVVVSVFVNPTQFGEGEDYETYPRTEREDAEKLQAARTDLLFLPAVAEIYPENARVNVTVSELSERYCGASRPGHFNGVATIVCKLFNMVQPDVAFFGEKDYQQLIVIRQMVADLNFPIRIQGVPIVRERDGLAMSSRNVYLSPEQRLLAPRLYQILCRVRDAILAGQNDFPELAAQHMRELSAVGFRPEYLVVCRTSDLREAGSDDRDLVILAAVTLGRARLIDNLSFSR